ncbi:uncharacterized protein FIBRA_08657 [Fibroporia radiculosa]|uniref:Tat pathway signal sequence n=1 Tax=Fibroporia radiculosa TaxID=599839 RepID=J4GI01_9APHY|nr:uncharacterized protein FIBRA_08657 [Fibroporia radiculosa]CCM06398.1 predicted protein [Fibroporia radiculosa]
MSPPSAAQYSPIAQGDLYDSSEKLLTQPGSADVGDNGACACGCHRPSGLRRFWPWILHVLVLFLNIIVFTLLLRTYTHRPERTDWDDLLNAHSPVYPAVEYNIVRFNGTLGFHSPYVGFGPAADAAWEKITMTNKIGLIPIRVPDDYLARTELDNARRQSKVRFLPEDGGGSMGTIDVFHHLHCVNMLRQYSYVEHYPEIQRDISIRPRFFRDHLDHCLEMLRQNLMCYADTALITYDWVAGVPKPFPNFNTVHQCRNFAKIQEWQRAHRMRVPLERIQATRMGGEGELSIADVDLNGVLTPSGMSDSLPNATD